MPHNSIGLIELSSIAAGYQVTDAMLKAADVDLVLSRSICSGKYMVMVRGEVGAIQASVSAGIHSGSFSVASLIEGADAAVKAAKIQLIEIRLAMALGGKAFVTLTGSVAAVQSAVEAGAQKVGAKGMLVNKVVIPSPRPELLNEMI